MGQSDEAMMLIDETIRLIRDRTATKNRVALIKHDAVQATENKPYYKLVSMKLARSVCSSAVSPKPNLRL